MTFGLNPSFTYKTGEKLPVALSKKEAWAELQNS
jgi:hypothetical protein